MRQFLPPPRPPWLVCRVCGCNMTVVSRCSRHGSYCCRHVQESKHTLLKCDWIGLQFVVPQEPDQVSIIQCKTSLQRWLLHAAQCAWMIFLILHRFRGSPHVVSRMAPMSRNKIDTSQSKKGSRWEVVAAHGCRLFLLPSFWFLLYQSGRLGCTRDSDAVASCTRGAYDCTRRVPGGPVLAI
jgi:hypothetical protein